MKNRLNKETLVFSLVQAAYWMSFCIIFAFSSVYLLGIGFGNTEIGMLVAVSGSISAVLQPSVGSMIDRSRTLTLGKAVIICGALMMVLGVGLLVLSGQLWAAALIYGLLITLLQILTPLVYSMGMERMNQGADLDFGLSRGMGSLAYAAASQIAGILTASVGIVVIPVMIIAVYGGFLAAVFLFQRGQKRSESNAKCRESGAEICADRKAGAGFFKRYSRYLALLAGVTLSFVSHNMLSNFAFQVMEYKGGGSSAMGTALAIAAVCELPTMFLFGWMVKKAGSHTWLKVSGIFFALKAAGTWMAGSIAVMYVIQVLQMFGFGLYVVSSVYYVNQIMKPEDRVKGQSYMTMTNTLGSVFASFAGGALIDHAGVGTFLGVSAGAAFAGMAIILWAAKNPVFFRDSIDGRDNS